MNELAAFEAFIRQTFLGDPALAALVGDRVYTTKPKAGALFPAVVIQYVPGRDAVNTAGATSRRIWLQPLYQIKACARSVEFTDADPVAARLDTILAGLQDTYDWQGTTYRVTALFSVGAIRYAEPGGIPFVWSGALWRFIIEVD